MSLRPLIADLLFHQVSPRKQRLADYTYTAGTRLQGAPSDVRLQSANTDLLQERLADIERRKTGWTARLRRWLPGGTSE